MTSRFQLDVDKSLNMFAEWPLKMGTFWSHLLVPFRLLLSLLLHMLNWLLAPVLLLGRIVGQICTLPIRLLVQFEVRLDPRSNTKSMCFDSTYSRC